MKRKILISVFLATILVLTSCIIINGDGFSVNNFDTYLQGTWELQELFPLYRDINVEINRNSISISGFNITPPLAGFTPDSLLNGYSEEESNISGVRRGKIHIQDRGVWQNPIEYIYWITASPQNEKRLTIITPPGHADLTLFFKN